MADGKVKSVSVVFQAFTDKFEKGTARAGNKLSSFAKKAAGLVGGFLAGRAAVAKFSKAMGDLDRLGKLSDRMQIDPNTLRGLDLMSSQLGTAFTQVEKGIQRMSRTIGEAREGITTGTTALKYLGLAAEDFAGMGVEDQYKMIADRIAAIEDPSRKAAVAFRIFGRSGQEMTNMLNLGAKGLEEYKKEAEALGGPISRGDIKQIEAANDAMDKLKRVIEGVFQQIAIRLSPAIEQLAFTFRTVLLPIFNAIGKAWDKVQKFITNSILYIMEKAEVFALIMERALNPSMSESEYVKRLKEIAERFKDARSIEFKSDEFKGKNNKGGKYGSALAGATTAPSLKSFVSAAGFQSSKAFDILNPNRPGSVAQDNKKANERTANAVEKIADSEAVRLVKKDIT